MPVIRLQSASADELTSDPSFVVTLDTPATQTVTVQYRTVADGSAVMGVDFRDAFGTITFEPGVTQQVVTITNLYSSANESDENFTFELHSPTNATLDGDVLALQAAGVIEDSNGNANNFAMFVSDPRVLETEGGQVALFEIRLSEPAPNTLSLDYATADGTALAGSDYTATSGSVTFGAGESVKFVSVPILGDSIAEVTETFSLNVTPAGTLQNGVEDNSGIAAILDDDNTVTGPVINIEAAYGDELTEDPSFVVTLSEAGLQTITVDFRTIADGSAVAGVDFREFFGTLTFLPGETQKTITVTNLYSSSDESDENFTLELHSPDNATLAGDVAALTATGVILDSNSTANDLALFVSDPKVIETDTAGQLAVFEVRLSDPVATTVTMDYETVDGTALAGSDYTATTGTLTFAPGQTVASVAVPITGDTVAEATEAFSLVVTPTGFIQNGVQDNTGIATIVSDDTDGTAPVISVEAQAADELNEDTNFIFTLSEPALQTVTVDYVTIADGSAVAGVDFREASGTVTFLPGETQQVVTITTNYSSADESDENFSLKLHSPNNATLAGDVDTFKVTGIIEDSNGNANDLALFVSDPEVVETDGAGQLAIFEIQLSAPSTAGITMDYTTSDGTAIAGSDYTATSGSITFAPGQTLASVAVPILGDTLAEVSETFSLIVTPSGFVQNGVQDNTGIATIIADDTDLIAPVISITPASADELNEDPLFLVSLSDPALQTVTVSYRTIQDGSAVAGVDYRESFGELIFAPGETQKFINVTNLYASADEADENFSLELYDATNATLAGDGPTLKVIGIIEDSNGSANDLALFVSDPKVVETDAAGQLAVFEITLSGPSSNPIVLTYNTKDGTAVAGEDYTATSGSITFAPGQTTLSVAVPITGDTDVEATEVFSLIVSPNGFIQNGVADSTGMATIVADDTVLGDGGVTGPDLPVLTLLPATPADELTEDPWFLMTLSEPSNQTVTVNYRTVADGSAVGGVDYREASGVVTFLPGETEKAVSITTLYSSANDSDENFSFEVFSPTNAVLSGDVDSLKATGIITDSNGAANNLALFVSDPEVVETNGDTQMAVFEVRLSVPSENEITMDYATSDGTALAGSDYVATTGTITFTPGQTFAAVMVPIIGDLVAEGSETFSLSVTPNGFIQNGTADSSGTARINDDDIDLGLAVDAPELSEGPLGPRTMTFTVSLETASTTTEIFTYETVDITAEGGTDYTPVTGTLTFDAGETEKTVDVIILNDRLTEPTETFALEVTENPGTAFETVEVGEGTILDYDFSVANTINGTNGNDEIAGGDGNDEINGRNGSDVLKGGRGADKVTGGRGSDNIEGGGGGDDLNGNKSADTIKGNGGDDTLKGETGFDKLSGGTGSDRLFGGASGDSLYGGSGKDFLFGGSGQDKLWGGGGADRFVFSSASETGTSSSSRDIIKDFKTGQGDKIDLRPMDAKQSKSGNQKFEFIGSDSFSDTKGELRVRDTGSDLLVMGDRNGDGRADFTILVENKSGLNADDFFL